MAWISGALSLGGALISSGASKDAANTQAGATAGAIGEQQREFDLTRSDQAPYRDAGSSTIKKLQLLLGLTNLNPDQNYVAGASPTSNYSDLLAAYNRQHVADHGMTLEDSVASGSTTPEAYNSIIQHLQNQASQLANPNTGATTPGYGDLNKKFSISDFWNDPVVQASYQSGLDLGTKALKNAAPLTTGLDSGAALKELTKFGTDYTGNMAAGSQARYVGDQTNQYNRLAGIAGVGQTATQATGTTGMNSANNISGLISGQGNAAAASKIAGANAWSGGLQSVSNWWNQQQMLDRFFPQSGGMTSVSQLSGMPGQYDLSNRQYG